MSKPLENLISDEWQRCRLCSIHCQTPRKAVIKHSLSAPYLLVGETPTRADTQLGEPFTGEYGDIVFDALELVITRECLSLQRNDFAATNILACAVYEHPDERRGFRTPSQEEATNCRPRLVQIFQGWEASNRQAYQVPPKGIIAIGKAAGKYLPPVFREVWPRAKDRPPICKISHPSYWLRTGGIHGHNAVEAMETLGDFLHSTQAGTWE